MLEHLDQARLVERRIGVGRTREARDAARDRCRHLRFERGLVLEARLAQSRGKVDESRCDDETARVDDTRRVPSRRPRIDTCNDAIGQVKRTFAIDAARRVDDAAVGDFELHAALAIMLITAMRTAIPNVTCGRMTARSPSATGESISTPRFIGPGCITIASGFASASLSCVRP